jgi:hypothetical protein
MRWVVVMATDSFGSRSRCAIRWEEPSVVLVEKRSIAVNGW